MASGAAGRGRDTAAALLHRLVARRKNGRLSVYRKARATDDEGEDVTRKPRTIWTDRDVQTERGQSVLDDVLGARVFRSPKPPALVKNVLQLSPSREEWALDFFAGSGTTAHAVIDLNRSGGVHGRNLRFVLVEMGEHFETVLKRRVRRVMFCPEWKEGHPATEVSFDGQAPAWVHRSPRLVKVLLLERYEDSLMGLELNEGTEDARLESPLRYIASNSSTVLLDTVRLERPFDYTLDVHTEEGVAAIPVDLPETFNTIAGVHAEKMRWVEHSGREYRLISGIQRGERVLVVWRHVGNLDPAAERAFLEAIVPDLMGEPLDSFSRIWHNADSAVPNGQSLDAEFHRLMFEPEPGLS